MDTICPVNIIHKQKHWNPVHSETFGYLRINSNIYVHIRLQIIHTCVVAKIHSHMCMWKKIQMANSNKHVKGGSRGSRGTAAMVPAPPPKNGKVVMLAEDRQTGLFFRSLFDTLSPIPSPLQQVLGRWFSEGRHLEIAGWQTSLHLHRSPTGPKLVFFAITCTSTKIFFNRKFWAGMKDE